MKVIAKYPFQGVPGMQQLSFPAGAMIRAKTASSQGGWMYGSYGNQNGWFPESYVEQHGGTPVVPRAPLTPVREWSIPLQVPTPRSPHLSYDNARADENDLPSLQSTVVDRNARASTPDSSHNDDRVENYEMMGGNPGELWGVPVNPPRAEERATAASPSFLQDEEKPVDIYRHAPPKKSMFKHRSDYTPEIFVQITSKPTQTNTPTYTSRSKVAPSTMEQSPQTAADFWKAHPGRADKAPTAHQAAILESQSDEVERVFQGLGNSEFIQIVQEDKKKKFPFIPKTLKKAAKKTKKTLREAVEKLPIAQRVKQST
jgi:Variant SH3 domain